MILQKAAGKKVPFGTLYHLFVSLRHEPLVRLDSLVLFYHLNMLNVGLLLWVVCLLPLPVYHVFLIITCPSRLLLWCRWVLRPLTVGNCTA